jgi:hypothetical protein
MKIITIILVLSSVLYGQRDTGMYNAKVLSINKNILYGKTIGQFLGSASGEIANDVIKVGVSFMYKDRHMKESRLVLIDLRLNHAQLAHYAESKYIKICVSRRLVLFSMYYMTATLNGVEVHYEPTFY